jgi:terminase small subunit / prophage DNA-packing protein
MLKITERTVTLGELAMVIGVSMQTMRDFLRKGIFEPSSPGRFLLVKNTTAYTTHIRTIAAGRTGETSRSLLNESQAALARAKAGVLTGKLVDVSEMQADAFHEHRKLRGLMLALPTRAANQATGLSRATLDLIEQEVRDVLTEMAYADFDPYRATFTRTR